MTDFLTDLGVTLPVLAAPMAGGPTTADLVVAAAGAGSMGFVAGGYRTADGLAAQVHEVRTRTSRFGVNLFVPAPVPVDRAAYARYRDRLRPEAERLGVELPGEPVEDDDAWRDKLDLLLADPVPVVTLTFAIPDRAAVDALHAAGTIVIQTVTTAGEAERAASAGVDALVVQGCGAGGHSGTLSPAANPEDRPLPGLVAEVRARVALPVVAAGGLGDPAAVAAVIGAGAAAVAVGTALLLTPEAGTSAPHRSALAGPDRGPTVLTRAFSGRPARALRNAFVDSHHGHAPTGYPALHHLTSPIRRAAVAAGDAEHVNLWAGTGYRSAVDRPAAAVLEHLAGDL